MVAAFFIPNSFFVAWSWIGLFAAWFFIIIQMILLVDFAHAWNEKWLAKMENGQKGYFYALLSVTGLLYAAALTVTILLFVFYTRSDESSCGLHKFFISFNMILGVIAGVASVHPRVQASNSSSGLLQGAVVFFYTTYLTWSAVANGGESDTCKPATDGNQDATIVVGAIITFIAVIYSSLRTSSASQLGKLGLGGADDSKPLLLDDKHAEEGGGSDDEDEESGRQKVCVWACVCARVG